jgi:hypothetical protein
VPCLIELFEQICGGHTCLPQQMPHLTAAPDSADQLRLGAARSWLMSMAK